MAGNLVQMDYEAIQATAKTFQTSAQIVNVVATVTIAVIEGWKAATFFAPGLIAYYTQWQNNIRDKSQGLQKLLNQMARSLLKAIQDHKNGDVQGKQYFMQGIASV